MLENTRDTKFAAQRENSKEIWLRARCHTVAFLHAFLEGAGGSDEECGLRMRRRSVDAAAMQQTAGDEATTERQEARVPL